MKVRLIAEADILDSAGDKDRVDEAGEVPRGKPTVARFPAEGGDR